MVHRLVPDRSKPQSAENAGMGERFSGLDGLALAQAEGSLRSSFDQSFFPERIDHRATIRNPPHVGEERRVSSNLDSEMGGEAQ